MSFWWHWVLRGYNYWQGNYVSLLIVIKIAHVNTIYCSTVLRSSSGFQCIAHCVQASSSWFMSQSGSVHGKGCELHHCMCCIDYSSVSSLGCISFVTVLMIHLLQICTLTVSLRLTFTPLTYEKLVACQSIVSE